MATQKGMWATTPRHWGLNWPEEGIYDMHVSLRWWDEEEGLQKAIWCHPNLPRSPGSSCNRATDCPTTRRNRAERQPWNRGEGRRCSSKTNEARQGVGGRPIGNGEVVGRDTKKGTGVYPKNIIRGNRGGSCYKR